ncbi:MaoC family dehydratase N-terminal domain-containing protein [Paralcaligenes sp. KSB-10]|uniref:MaoC/PaaZ C-terminal domain-containing protein n=1 Tax=Paralcaligenes sp. KSB-10 TaxID=2901142 RepID=UPI001E65AD0A|nr:MaoC/PaaZ C-terminal domain-containing protein [Paralcaligenes sp. KSB-10]UHL65438.1 MaoC family dehydratase N-terminal domain-containing protein [Paralcaligenes sp. KSB-10]
MIDAHQLLSRKFEEIIQTYNPRDAMLYALSIGLGADPLDERQLRFVYEQNQIVFPTFALVLGYPGFWAKEPDTGIDWKRLVHAEQSIHFHETLPASGTIKSTNKVKAIYDKGPERGALLLQERQLADAASGRLLATISQLSLLRGDGGCGDNGEMPPKPHQMPDRVPDCSEVAKTLPQQALLYRLNGDFNPLHADPRVADEAGFGRPILHGLCSMGIACHAVLRNQLDYEIPRMAGMRARFTAPVFPGDELRTDMWRDGDEVSFRMVNTETGKVVLNGGRVTLG